MYVRIKKSGSKNRPHQYLQIVESFRDGKTVRQRVIATLGRVDQLRVEGKIDGLIRSLSRFSEQLRVIEAARKPEISSCSAKIWGPSLVFGRLWRRQGLPEVLQGLADGRRFSFNVSQVAFALALQRLMEPGSDLQGCRWLDTVEAEGFEGIELQYLYRTVGFLAEVRGKLERQLFLKDRDLFNQTLDLVFIDTTSTYAFKDKQTGLFRRGYSKDHRSDLPQVVVCVALDQHGWPIAWEIFPGNTADIRVFEEIIGKLRNRFSIRRVIVVADRGMISKENLSFLGADTHFPYEYIVGCRMRRQKEVSEEVLGRAGRYQEVSPTLKVKEVVIEDRRYIVCMNAEEARKDAMAREVMVESVQQKIEKQGAKSLIGNRGYARFLKAEKGSVGIAWEAVKRDARFDGKFVLRTNTDLAPLEVAKSYKDLWRVERTFREEKSTLEVRPIFHHKDSQCVGHIVSSFLALRLEIELQRILDEKKIEVSWPQLMTDLKRLIAVRLRLDGQRYLVRTDFEGCVYKVFQAVGLKPPNIVTPLAN
jgi:hypothetical protein